MNNEIKRRLPLQCPASKVSQNINFFINVIIATIILIKDNPNPLIVATRKILFE